MDFSRDSEFPADLSPLAWVHEELRRTLESVHKTLRRFLRDNEARSTLLVGGETLQPNQLLQTSAGQLHQVAGVLSVVGMPAGTAVLRASERAVQQLAEAPINLDLHAIELIERAHFALLALISRLLAGNRTSTLSLFPAYRALQEYNQAERVHPADLWSQAWSWRELPTFPATAGLRADAVRNVFESALLKHMRAPAASHARLLSELCAGLASAAREAQSRTLWQLASAQFEAQAQGLLKTDTYAKRLCSRLLSQLRASSGAEVAASDRLGQDLLFFCAQARVPEDAGQAPRLMAVRQGYALDLDASGDYEDASLGRIDPGWVSQAKRRVAAAKESWSSAAEGEDHRLGGLSEQFTALCESLAQLFPEGAVLGDTLQRAAVATLRAKQPPAPALAMEVATALLYIEAALEDAAFDQPEQGERVLALARRISAAAAGDPPKTLESWMEDLYRRVSDRQTLGSVVHELRASLTEVERQIDEYFRAPEMRELLIPVPNQLQAMRGVLSVLGLDQGAQACVRMRDEVDNLANTEVDASLAGPREIFDRLANNLGALGFMIDMLSVQPQLAKRMFSFDESSGRLSTELRRQKAPPVLPPGDSAGDLISQVQAAAQAVAEGHLPAEDLVRDLERIAQQARAADEPSLAAAAQSAQRLLDTGSEPAPSEQQGQALAGDSPMTLPAEEARTLALQSLQDAVAARAPAAPEPLPPSAPLPEDAAALDQEMLEIFLAEAEEVSATARTALAQLADDSQNQAELTTVRRAFHTLKGSSRMVGLAEFGEGAWACEQLYNARLAEQRGADTALLSFSHQALDYLGHWLADIAAQRFGRHDAAGLRRSADALRLQGELLPLQPATQADAAAAPVLHEAAAPVIEPLEAIEPLDVAVEPLTIEELEALLPAMAEPQAQLTAPMPLPELTPEPLPLEPLLDSLDLDLNLEPAVAESALQPEPQALAPMPSQEAPTLELLDLQFDEQPAPEIAAIEALPTLELTVLPLEDLNGLSLDLDLPALGNEALEGRQVEALEEPALDLSELQTLPPVDVDASSDASLQAFELPLDEGLLAELGLDQVIEPAPAQDHPALPEHGHELAAPVDGPHEPTAGSPQADTDTEPADVEAAQHGAPVLTLVADHGQRLDEHDSIEAELASDEGDDSVKVIGPLRISITLFNIFLNEADELSRRLNMELSEWTLELSVPVPSSCEALAHKLAGNAATVGYEDLSALARALEHALERAALAGRYRDADGQLFVSAAEEIRRLLHQFAAGFLKSADAHLLEGLQAYEALDRRDALASSDFYDVSELPALDVESLAPELPVDFHAAEPAPADMPPAMVDSAADLPANDLPELTPADVVPAHPEGVEAAAAASAALAQDAFQVGLADDIDPELFPVFEEEAQDLLRALHAAMREWQASPHDLARAAACMRQLHTFKGGARLTGAMALGDQAHRLESAIEQLITQARPDGAGVSALQDLADDLQQAFERLRQRPVAPQAVAAPVAAEAEAVVDIPTEPAAALVQEIEPASDEASQSLEPEAEAAARQPSTLPEAAAAPLLPIDWSRLADGRELESDSAMLSQAQAQVRVRGAVLERMAAQAGEVSIRRARIEGEVGAMKSALVELEDNLNRLRTQLRELELQAEAQMGSRREEAKQLGRDFDPLEFDRYTRFQELTRMMAESVNDVATVQRSLLRNVQAGEDELAGQHRLTRELQDDLLRTRMVQFDSLGERMHRVVRQAAREVGKQVQLEISGSHVELDRSVLERLIGSFEHLLRNSVIHGIEMPEQRVAAGKPALGTVRVDLSQEGNEVLLRFQDDGAGLDLARIRERGEAHGLLKPGQEASDEQLMQLIFAPGFSTASEVTELAGRGVGMDVVRSEVNTLGGYVETASVPGQGSSFSLRVPLTTALTQVVQLRCGDLLISVPANLIDSVLRLPVDQVEQGYASGELQLGEMQVPMYWLGGLLQHGDRGVLHGRHAPVVLVRSAHQRVALHVDEVVGKQEVVVKNLGPQLIHVPGLAGISLLASGDVALIYNPVALANVYGEHAHALLREEVEKLQPVQRVEEQLPPLVLVVDDSLTVRRVTQRLLEREGYRVRLAKDGLDAMEQLAGEELPAVVLSDIEMPRMDGFDLVRNLRADPRLAPLPVIMITSRIAQKHRDYAHELGVDDYLGKPYDEDLLLSLIARYTAQVSKPGADIAATH